jgi:gluconolactonase
MRAVDGTAGSFIGPNGLAAEPAGTVLMVQHSNRQIVRIGADRQTTVVVDRFEGKRLNSPNDLAFGPGGAIYFTDPPYGLPGQDEDPARELDFNGVYRFADGQLTALVRDLGRPNGIAFSPDQRTMYVSNSEATRKVIMAYDWPPTAPSRTAVSLPTAPPTRHRVGPTGSSSTRMVTSTRRCPAASG